MSVVTSSICLVPPSILSSTNDHHRVPTSRQYSSAAKRSEQRSLSRNHVYGDTAADSFLVSSSNTQSSATINQQDGPRLFSTPNRRYISSFKTLVHSTNGKHAQRLSYVNDSVIILKLSKENTTENNGSTPQLPDKNSPSSMPTSTSIPTQSRKQSLISPSRLSPVLKQDPSKRRTTANDSSSTISTNNHLNLISNSTNSMATSTSSQSPSNPSLFAYRNSIVGGNTIRQRAFAETPTNNVLITTERIKSNHISSSMRPTRQPLATPTATCTSTQPPQRNISQNGRTRTQQEKSNPSKDVFEYPDPFTNCPPEFLSKLAQLTKLQLDTIDWEKKRRFTRKKPTPNGITQGKDSP